MAKIVNIRNIPAPVYRKLKKRAEAAGLSLPRYVLRVLKTWQDERRIERLLARRLAPQKQFPERRRSRKPTTLSTPAAEIIREGRGPLRG